MEIRVASGLAKRLRRRPKDESESPRTGWLLGWHVADGVVALGCASGGGPSAHDLVSALPDLLAAFPAGLDVVGAFACGGQPYDDGTVVEFFRQLRLAGFQGLDETNEFCFLTGDDDDDPASELLGYLYDDARETVRQAVTVVADVDSSEAVLCRVTGTLTASLPLEPESGVDDAWDARFRDLVDVAASPAVAFRLRRSRVLLRASSTFEPSTPTLREDAPCSVLHDFVDNDDGRRLTVKGRKTRPVLKWDLLFGATGEDAVRRTASCLPIVRYERRDFEVAALSVPVDVLVAVPESCTVGELPKIFARGICHQLGAVRQCVVERGKENVRPVQIHHFKPDNCDHFVSLPYPKDVAESDLAPLRRKMHERFLLPDDRPALRRTNAHVFPDDADPSPYLVNPHEHLKTECKDGEETSTVYGSYSYHHYMQDRVDDDGWGCAYRSLQTIVSWFRHQGYTSRPVPTHEDIQKALVEVGDKPAKFVGSKRWIGSMEVSYCLQQLLGVNSKIMNVSSGSELSGKARELGFHFKKQGTPVMIGGGVLAHTILGVKFDSATGDAKFLVLDPHYTGSEDLNAICNKGWCGWKGGNFWDQNAYYNLCLPQRPSDL